MNILQEKMLSGFDIKNYAAYAGAKPLAFLEHQGFTDVKMQLLEYTV